MFNNSKPHQLFFSIGFIFYLLLPIVVGYFELMKDMPGMDSWHNDFSQAKIHLGKYLWIVFSYYLCFMLGSFSIHLLPIQKSELLLPKKIYQVNFLSLVGVIFLMLIFGMILNNREVLFSGYDNYNISLLGPLATINVVAVVLLFYLYFNSSHLSSRLIFGLVIFLSSVLLIGFGSRMYVLIPIISLFIYKIYYSKNPWSFKKIVGGGAMLVLIFLWIGSWRIGEAFNVRFLGYLLIAEPVFTWWSTATFLAQNELESIHLPLNYLSSFLNILPSYFFTDKADLIVTLGEQFNYQSPLGADSLFVNIQGNFGWFFGNFFLFLLGLFYSSIGHLAKKSNFFLSYYVGLVALIPFQLFRDNFGILNKQIFWNMLLLPCILILAAAIMRFIVPKKLVVK